MNTLWVVSTPIGNLKDITLRSLEVLRSVNYIICEDSRITIRLLEYYQIHSKRLISYFAPREEEKIPKIIKILEKESVALVVDAGMPTISDPGYRLIKSCLENGIEVEVLPGPSAFLTALVGSGLPIDKFVFLGFLPKKGLVNYLEKYKNLKITFVFYESNQRLIRNLFKIKKVFNNGYVVIARELSKIHEEYIRGELDEVVKILKDRKLKGELTIIFRPD
ncbi:MAG: 16S rRNA (cytidine(1402)-2'-O)-methyltransferase [Patescibacteria group bacterium]|nr:16S rRNA (cytidine(1402)-2'-O)-methyltransferase [Patescibacteria group bacterium]